MTVILCYVALAWVLGLVAVVVVAAVKTASAVPRKGRPK